MTPPPALAIIAAVARNGVIGVDGGLPWRLPADLKRFRALTEGHAVIMGRRTWQSLGRPLPNRQNIVVSRRGEFAAEGALVVPSLAEALARVEMPEPAFCIGGGELYREALPVADTMYLTEINRDFEGNARFPRIAPGEWREVERETGPLRESPTAASVERVPAIQVVDAAVDFSYSFVTYQRRVATRANSMMENGS